MAQADQTIGRAIAAPVTPVAAALARAVVSLGLAGLFVFLLSSRLSSIDLPQVARTVSDVPPLDWLLALLGTAVSFWAVGHYDAVVHRHFGTGIPAKVARRAGISAIAVSQTLGLGVITGSIVRWRMLPGQSLSLATKLTAAVAVSFLAGWAVVTAVTLLVLPDAPFKMPASLVVALAGGVVILVLASPHALRRRLPNLITLSRLVGLAAIDTLAAAAALHMMLPADLALPMATFLPAFLLALGAGLVSGTPGGIGAFEVAFLALLPTLPPEPLLGAILAWRLVYFAVPACLGGVIAMLGPGKVAPCRPAQPLRALPAEGGILRQGELAIEAEGTWLVGRTPHLMVGLFDPLTATQPALRALQQGATDTASIPVLYKCSARVAVVARRQGWQAVAVAREAWLTPRSFCLATAPRAGLRRKLRRAAAAGVTVAHASRLPLADMSRVATLWAHRHGGERGFSMGRYAADYVSGQRVYLAWHNGRLIAFATFHEGPHDWALDLMRHGPDLPDGTMHALICAAIADAASANIRRLSLAAVPEAAFGCHRWFDALLHRAGREGSGLRHFKAAFAPEWQPLYLAAPSRTGLVLAAIGIACAIARPPPLPPQRSCQANMDLPLTPEHGTDKASAPVRPRGSHG